MNASRGVVAAYLAVLALAIFGLFHHLDDRLLWADEAETALLAVNIAKFGLPVANDGKNDLTRTRPGSQSEDALWIWSPWLDEYVVAASFLALGKSTFAARLPFAFLSLAAVALLGWIGWRASRSHELVITATLLFATCVPFLLHARQSRYYALLIFAQLWVLFGMQRLATAPSPRAAAHVVGGLVAIFYCNYIVLPGNLIGLAVAALLLRDTQPGILRWTVASFGGFALLAAPWLLYARPEGQATLLGFENFVPYLVYYVGELHFHVVSLALGLVALGFSVAERRSERVAALTSDESHRVWGTSASRVLRIVMVSLIGSQLVFLGFAPDRFFRYITPLIPLVILLSAFVLVRFVSPRPLRVALVALMILSNGLATSMRLPFPKAHATALTYPIFLQSITRDYEDRLEAVLAYLDGKVDSEDSVYVDDHELPLIFYTEMRVLEARDSKAIWREPIDAHPEWVLPVGPSALLDRKQLKFQPGPHYEAHSFPVPRSRRGGSRPHPDAHAFFTADTTQDFVLYRKKTRNSEDRSGQ